MSTHVIGTYDFEQQKVTGALVALEIGKSENYQIHNEELLEESKRLVTEIQNITGKMIATKAEKDELKAAVASVPRTTLPPFDKVQMKRMLFTL